MHYDEANDLAYCFTWVSLFKEMRSFNDDPAFVSFFYKDTLYCGSLVFCRQHLTCKIKGIND